MGTATSVQSAAARAWRPAGMLPLPPDAAAAAEPLTVVTYNILADKYATGGMHAYCPPQFLAWPYRKQRILEELLGLRPDILALQEVERPFFEAELEPLMAQHGYEALYYSRKRRPFDPPSTPQEGIGLLYRTERLERQASKAVRLGDSTQPGSYGGKFWGAVRGRDDGVLLALLRDRVTRRQLLAGCTHLFWDPRFPDIKAAQAHLLCRAAENFLRQQGLLHAFSSCASLPMVLCGDFNSLPFKRHSDAFDTVPPGQTLTSGVYSLLAGCGQPLPSTHPDHPAQRQQRGGGGGGASHAQQAAQAAQLGQLAGVRLSSGALCLESAAVAAWGREAPVTNKTASFAGCLDYVWLSRGHWAVSAALHPPYRFDRPPPGQPAQVADPGDVSDLPPIPNQHFPSDHLALGFRLHMLPPGGDGGH